MKNKNKDGPRTRLFLFSFFIYIAKLQNWNPYHGNQMHKHVLHCNVLKS